MLALGVALAMEGLWWAAIPDSLFGAAVAFAAVESLREDRRAAPAVGIEARPEAEAAEAQPERPAPAPPLPPVPQPPVGPPTRPRPPKPTRSRGRNRRK